ncbi:MAG: 5-oxoprolinase subunit PxpB [Sediminibacterium sp.]|jgi:inhibitor of KinA|nr:5-oxoprolinase subunit PxpB [Sediminibacterium sp.]
MDASPEINPVLRINSGEGQILPVTVEWQGEQAFTLVVPPAIDTHTHVVIRRLFHQLQQASFSYITDLIPAYHTLTIVFDATLLPTDHSRKSPGNKVLQKIIQYLSASNEAVKEESRMLRIPVCYHSSLAPDLHSLAKHLQLPTDELIGIHVATTYRVFMLGFLPGFAYLGPVDERIVAPRHTRPRSDVPAGSVGIAGAQTGIYPIQSPGGWQLIGRTPLQLFTPHQLPPCLLQPGDEVVMYPISLDEFNQWPTT